jgi:hypothetical protein
MNRSQTFRRCWVMALITLAMSISGVFLPASTAHAQVSLEGHAVLAVGSYSNQFASGNDNELAAGGEILFVRRVGVSAEVALVAFGGRASLDGTVHFPHGARTKLDPFVQAGLTRSTGEYGNAYHGWNVAAGVSYWLRPRLGIRVEFVETVQHLDTWTEQYHLARFGISFR